MAQGDYERRGGVVMTLTQERLREVLDYNPETGEFRWRARKGVPFWIRPGMLAGGNYGRGYRGITIDGRLYPTHRLAWLWMTGRWPETRGKNE